MILKHCEYEKNKYIYYTNEVNPLNTSRNSVVRNLSTLLEQAEFVIDDSNQTTAEEIVLSCVSCEYAFAPRPYSLA